MEFVRVIAKALYSLCYKKTGKRLEEESGIPLHSAEVNLFMQQVIDGNWDEGAATFNQIDLEGNDHARMSVLLLIKQQKFYELIEDGPENVLEASKILKTEIEPLCNEKSIIRDLSSLLMFFPKPRDTWDREEDFLNARANMRSGLLWQMQKLLPPTMMPENRLEELVGHALIGQRGPYGLYKSLYQPMSLYSDHYCGKIQVPSRTIQILEEHDDVVWIVKFSHYGKYLASAPNDQTAIIWEVDTNDQLFVKHTLCGHQKPVTSVSWSPDDKDLLTCAVEEAVRRWDVATGNCLQVFEKVDVGLISCAWHPDGIYILSGHSDRSICMWQLDGIEVMSWKGKKTLSTSDLVMMDDEYLLSICDDNSILFLNINTKSERFIEEEKTITSFSLSEDNRFLLVNLLDEEIHVWDLTHLRDDMPRIFGRYKGHESSQFVIRSCFGGINEDFIAGGSEDSQVYIWHRWCFKPVHALSGHSGKVNCVSWNPANPHMLASASNDRTIRIWGLDSSDDCAVPKCRQQFPYGTFQGPRKTNLGSHWLGAVHDMVTDDTQQVTPLNLHEVDDSNQFVDYKDRKKVLGSGDNAGTSLESKIESAAPGLILRKRKQVETTDTSINDDGSKQFTSSASGEQMAEGAVALFLKHQMGLLVNDDDEKDDRQVSRKDFLE